MIWRKLYTLWDNEWLYKCEIATICFLKGKLQIEGNCYPVVFFMPAVGSKLHVAFSFCIQHCFCYVLGIFHYKSQMNHFWVDLLVLSLGQELICRTGMSLKAFTTKSALCMELIIWQRRKTTNPCRLRKNILLEYNEIITVPLPLIV